MPRTSLQFETRGSVGLGYLLLVLGVAATALGIYRNNVGLAALGAALVLPVGGVYFCLCFASRRLRVTRIAPDAAYEYETVEIRFLVENRARFLLFFPRISEIFAPEIHTRKDLILTDRLIFGEAVERGYEGFCVLPRGIYPLGPSVVRLTDPLGWFEVRKQLDDEQTITVYPTIQKIGVKEGLGPALLRMCPEAVSFGVGESDDLRSVREYRPGDSLRRIHWGLTAHHGYPVVREFTRPSVGDLHVFLDLHRRSLIGAGRSSSLETSVRIAASFASHALDRGNRVEVLVGDDPGGRVPLGQGPEQLHRVLDLLVAVKPAGRDAYLHTLDAATESMTAGSTAVVMLSPYLYGNPKILHRLSEWVRRGIRVLAIVYDQQTFRRVWVDSGNSVSVQEALQGLRSGGVDVYHVPCAVDLRFVFAREAS